jgi:hypothetical protein
MEMEFSSQSSPSLEKVVQSFKIQAEQKGSVFFQYRYPGEGRHKISWVLTNLVANALHSLPGEETFLRPRRSVPSSRFQSRMTGRGFLMNINLRFLINLSRSKATRY